MSARGNTTVFISYSHKDEAWKHQLLPHLTALEQAGVKMKVWEDRQIDAGAKWYPALQEAMGDAAVAILLISADYLASGFCVKEEVPFLIDRQEKCGMRLIPILIRPCLWKIHRWLADRQMLPRDGKCVAIDYPGDQADTVFSDVAERVYAHFATIAKETETTTPLSRSVQKVIKAHAPSETLLAAEPPRKPEWPPLTAARVDFSHLPQTGSALFGRDEELDFLDKTWAALGQPDTAATRVLAFKAQGGVGKSALINRWLSEMTRDNFRGATRVFGWSFYSQGVREQGAASADIFMAAALRFFGDETMAGSPASAWDKGARLAQLIGAERTLLVLDGMEPLQSAHWVDRGKLRDPGLESILRGLARQSAGLCLITTREPLAELGKKASIVERDLEQITPQAGRALLRASHVVGTDAELEHLAERFGPHALAISLLAVYLHEQPGRGIAPAKQLEQLPGKEPVDRVLAGFENLLANSAELEALRLLGFFDRPADEGCLSALRARPTIPGLTERLAEMADSDWPRVLARLDKLHLLHTRQGDTGKQFVDTHPLIREHFAQHVREQKPNAWRAAHRRLYEHLCATTPDKPQPTLEDLQPLYQAVAHGCQAGLQQEACDNVLFARIRQRNEDYAVSKLGAFGSDLGAVACFFEQPWSCVLPALADADQTWLLNQAAFRLRALGRLTESLEPMRVSTEQAAKRKDWENAAIGASNLSELELTLGEVDRAVGDAAQSLTYADGSGDAFVRMAFRTTYAGALHQAGHRAEAETRFREAEQMQQEMQPNYPQLYSQGGFLYCDLLLATPERAAWQAVQRSEVGGQRSELMNACRAVEKRAAQTLKWAEQNNSSLLTLALDHLTLGRAALYRAILENSDLRPPTSDLSHIDAAVDGLRRSGNMDELPRGLLTRAWLRSVNGDPAGARADLDDAWEIAERGPMKLFMADIRLYRARLFFREAHYTWDSPAADLAAAEALINSCGYHRRDEELADAKRALLSEQRGEPANGG